jgi:transcriptional regulator with XRE-family HTH domain
MRDPIDNSTRDAFSSPGELSVGLIRHVRKLFGMTQEQFGRLVGMHYVTISNLERKDLALDDELRHKLLMLQEISRIPGAPELLRYVAKNYTGTDALFLGLALHKVVA